jgi:hypothetical protein
MYRMLLEKSVLILSFMDPEVSARWYSYRPCLNPVESSPFHFCLSSPIFIFSSFEIFQLKFCIHFWRPHACYMACSFQRSRFNQPNTAQDPCNIPHWYGKELSLYWNLFIFENILSICSLIFVKCIRLIKNCARIVVLA